MPAGPAAREARLFQGSLTRHPYTWGMTGRTDFTQEILQRIEEDLRAQLDRAGRPLAPGSRLFPEQRGGDEEGSANPLTRHILGGSSRFLQMNLNNACSWVRMPEMALVQGENPIARSYMDLARLFTGLHEAAHVLVPSMEAPPGSGASREERDRYRHMHESTADVTAAIYMLNRYPDNPRVREFLGFWARHRLGRAQGEPDHDTAFFLTRLLENPNHGGSPSGHGINISEAAYMAYAFVHQQMPEWRRTQPEESMQARETLCLSPLP
jgi:hypothetical protein